jgi:hypothetical protein
MRSMANRAAFHCAYLHATQQSFLEGHELAFAWFGGVFATESFYKKLNRIARECQLSRYDALRRGLDALLRENEVRNSALNRNIKSPAQSEVFRRTMGQVSRNYWATVGPEEKRWRGQNSARARWSRLAAPVQK